VSRSLIYNKIFPVGTGIFIRNYQLQAWDDDQFQIRKLGFGSDTGWTATGNLVVSGETPQLEWTNIPIHVDANEKKILLIFEKEFLKWLINYDENIYIEHLEEDAEWSVL
jgi:hypothetical protein